MFSHRSIVLILTLISILSVPALFSGSADADSPTSHSIQINNKTLRLTVDRLVRGSGSLGEALPLFATDSWFTAADVSSGDNFGAFTAISGDTVVIGNPFDSDALESSGSAYVFVWDGEGWVQQQKLTPTSPSIDQNFGRSVAISGDTIVVGASGELSPSAYSGAAYVFVRSGTTWLLEQRLTLTDPMEYDLFGCSVGISEDTIVVGATGDSDDGSLPGSASVFVRNSVGVWSLQQKLRAHDALPNVMFGHSVAISGNTVLVGDAFYPINNGRYTYGVYVFERADMVWSEEQKLGVSNSRAGYEYGRAIAIDGDTIVVGAPFEAHGSNPQGSAYVYVRERAQWSQQQKLFVRDSATIDRFGGSVAISGATIIVGNNFDDEQRGAAYVFVRDARSNWIQQGKLTASDAAPDNYLGTSVATNGSIVLAGSPGKAVSGPSSGAVYYSALPLP